MAFPFKEIQSDQQDDVLNQKDRSDRTTSSDTLANNEKFKVAFYWLIFGGTDIATHCWHRWPYVKGTTAEDTPMASLPKVKILKSVPRIIL